MEVISFGAPRVANINYANTFNILTNGKSVRYIVKGDPIVVMPECLTTLVCNYKHTGVQYVCEEGTK